MNTMKKTISAALALIITLCAAAACGESADMPADTTVMQTDPAPETEAETTADHLSELPDDDQGGRTFTIVAQHTSERFNFPRKRANAPVNCTLLIIVFG